MGDVMGKPEEKANFAVELMQKDEMLLLGLLGDKYQTLSQKAEYQSLSKEKAIELVSKSQFAGKLHTDDANKV